MWQVHKADTAPVPQLPCAVGIFVSDGPWLVQPTPTADLSEYVADL